MTCSISQMSELQMSQRATWKRITQLVVVLLCAVAVKQYYSTASVNQLRWILAPTTALVEMVSGSRFEFEPYAGYISSDRTFVIAASCSGVNFLITAFLMLSLRKLWRDWSANSPDKLSSVLSWMFIPAAGVVAYLATVVANTVRISTALRLRQLPFEMGWLTGSQLHRFEGIFIYFGFLLLLFLLSEKMSLELTSSSPGAGISKIASAPPPGEGSGLVRQSVFPLLIYYATTLGIPLANGAFRSGTTAADFWEHSAFVVLTPLIIILPLATLRLCRSQRVTGLYARSRSVTKSKLAGGS